jgi:4a-hydroxytetrahydrobiopterin dehydratase
MNDDINKLLNSQCRAVSKKEGAMNLSQIEKMRHLTPQWQFCANDNVLRRVFHFDSYAQTIEFVNSVATIAEAQDHHPDLLVTYKRCKVCYKTHTVNGVTENEFICAAQIDVLHS